MSNNSYALQVDLKLLSRYESEELSNIKGSEWEVRNAQSAITIKYQVIRESLIGLNTLGIRPIVSLYKIIRDY